MPISMTEKEARQKLCPLIKQGSCVTSSCMAWEVQRSAGYKRKEFASRPSIQDEWGFIQEIASNEEVIEKHLGDGHGTPYRIIRTIRNEGICKALNPYIEVEMT